jgi:hypothetical protein
MHAIKCTNFEIFFYLFVILTVLVLPVSASLPEVLKSKGNCLKGINCFICELFSNYQSVKMTYRGSELGGKYPKY